MSSTAQMAADKGVGAVVQEDELVVLGKISGVFGVKGWVRVFSYTDPRENVVHYGHWYLKQQGQWHRQNVEAGEKHGKLIVAKLEACDDRECAYGMMGAIIAIHHSQLPALQDGEYYWRDLIGLRVVNLQGVELGVVKQLMETGANDVLVVEDERERLIPFTQGHTVQRVSLEEGVIEVDWDPEF